MIDEIKARCSLSEYASMCRRHDWSCAMSDDHSVYLRGTKNKRTLAELSSQPQENLGTCAWIPRKVYWWLDL